MRQHVGATPAIQLREDWTMLRRAPSPVRAGIRALVVLSVLSVLSGCATVQRGGAPEPSFDVDTDLKELAAAFGPAASIKAYYEKGNKATAEDRNRFITARLTLMNIRYIQFIRDLTSDRQLLDSASDMLVLGLNLAATTTGGATAKSVLSAISAGITGSKQIVDKNFYFQKSIPALVAQMNAERKARLVPILTGTRGTLQEYPFPQAVTDLDAYYQAGTLIGAIQAIQADAGAKERKQDAVIATLTPLTRAEVASKVNLTQSVGALSDVDKGKAALRNLGVGASDLGALDTLAKVKQELQRHVRGARTPEQLGTVKAAFESAGILVQ